MPEQSTAPSRIKPKRNRWRKLLRGLGWALLALLLLHWPLIIFGGPVVARILAKKQHVDVHVKFSGTLWTNLSVWDLHATPLGDGPTPVELIHIDKLRFDYNLWRLATKGLGEFLSSYEVHHADLRFVALPSETEEEHESKKSVVETLRTILAQPAAYSDRVLIDDFSIRVRSPENETVVSGLSALFDPKVTGYLRIARLQIPGLPVWENLDSQTTYQNRNLIQRGLQLGPIYVDEFNYDASHRAEGRGKIALRSHGFGGELSIVLTGQEKQEKGQHLAKAYDTHLQVSVQGVRVREAAAYFGVKDVPIERLEGFTLDFTGDPEKPRTWAGTARAAIENIASGSFVIPRIQLASQFGNGTATASGGVRFGENTVQLDSRIGLPETVSDWFASSIDATAHVDVTDMPGLTATFLPGKQAAGVIGLDAKIGLHQRKADVSAKFNLRDVSLDSFSVTTAAGTIQASTVLRPNNAIQVADLDANADVTLEAMKVNTFSLDGARLVVDVVEGNLNLKQLEITRGDNAIVASGRGQLPADMSRIAQSPGEFQATIRAPAIEAFGLTAGGQTIKGKLEAKARAQFADGKASGDVQMDGSVGLGGFKAERLGATVHLRGDTIQLEEFVFAINHDDRLSASGRLGINEPRQYDGKLDLGISDLSVLEPLATVFGVKESLGGKLKVAWAGTGSLSPASHEGEASVKLSGAKYGKNVVDLVELGGNYTAESARGHLHATAGPTAFDTDLVWAEQNAALRDIDLRQAKQRVLSGDITFSLATAPGAKFDPLKQRISARLDADRLDIEKLFSSFHETPPASGIVSLHLAAEGTPARPELELKVTARALKAKAAPQFDAAEVDLAVNYKPGALTLDATARQPLVKPIEVHAKLPVDVEKVIAEKRLDPKLPLDATVSMPPTSLAVLPKLTPQVRRANGTIEVNVRAAGTVEHPILSGAAVIALQDARLTNENVPAIGRFDARLVFAEQTLRFERFRGVLGGGAFELGGNVNLENLRDPVFDLRLKADQVLVKRDDAITIRSDADVKVTGPLSGGSLAGAVFVTQSRFFKEIDILPIALPGKSKPAPKTAPAEAMNISLPPPLDAWKFDLAIKTHENDPFLIRGNLANGRVALDLHLGGEGKQPWIEGTATIEQFTGSLPFSTITVENGHVYFTREQPFQPTLDIQAQSKIRDYLITAYIYGNAHEPQLQLSSEPPLSHGDIVTLLATGTTTGELSGNADLLASRAAIYAVEELWRKIFKKKAPPKEAAPRNDASFRDRFNLELGGLDQRTGSREATARFKINDQTYIIGEFDTMGQFTGSLKYLLRFR